jgi:hypothetical protein
MGTVAKANVLARSTDTKLHQQTEQLGRTVDNLDEMDSTLKRSQRVLGRMLRRVSTDKYIWCLVFLVAVAIIFVIIWQSTKGSDDADADAVNRTL